MGGRFSVILGLPVSVDHPTQKRSQVASLAVGITMHRGGASFGDSDQ